MLKLFSINRNHYLDLTADRQVLFLELRGLEMLENKVGFYKFGEFLLDVENSQLRRNGVPVSLTQKSLEILTFLVENQGRILKKDEFLDSLWEGNFVEEANLTQHIYMLRKKLKQSGDERTFIETIPKNGYRFVAEVEKVNEEEIVSSPSIEAAGVPQMNETVRNDTPNKDYVSFAYHEKTNTQRQMKGGAYNALAVICLVVFAAISVAGYFYFSKKVNSASSGVSEVKSIAVLPFKQIGEVKDAKLGIGIADVLIARLANIQEIAVRPTTSIIRFSDTGNTDPYFVGEKLGVDCIIQGTIQRDKDVVRITTQLYDVKQKRSIWTEKYDEKYSDIFALQDKISEKIAQKISSDNQGASPVLPYKQYTKNAEAYRAYSMGLSFWSMHTRLGFEKAIKNFNEAIKKDSEFVMAYAYLSDSYAHTGHISHMFSVKEAHVLGIAAANKALELDPKCAEAMASLALIYANNEKHVEAFELMKKSVEIKPNDAHSRHRISWMYANKGDIERAVNEMKIAQKLDPQSAYMNLFLSEILLLAKHPAEATVYLNKTLEIEPGSYMAQWRFVEAFEHQGLYDEAESKLLEIQKRIGRKNKSVRLVLSRLYAKNNKKVKAKRLLESVLSEGEIDHLNSLAAMTHIALGEEELAVKKLKPVVDSIKDSLYRIKYEPNLDPIRSNPTFAKYYKAKEASQNG